MTRVWMCGHSPGGVCSSPIQPILNKTNNTTLNNQHPQTNTTNGSLDPFFYHRHLALFPRHLRAPRLGVYQTRLCGRFLDQHCPLYPGLDSRSDSCLVDYLQISRPLLLLLFPRPPPFTPDTTERPVPGRA